MLLTFSKQLRVKADSETFIQIKSQPLSGSEGTRNSFFHQTPSISKLFQRLNIKENKDKAYLIKVSSISPQKSFRFCDNGISIGARESGKEFYSLVTIIYVFTLNRNESDLHTQPYLMSISSWEHIKMDTLRACDVSSEESSEGGELGSLDRFSHRPFPESGRVF